MAAAFLGPVLEALGGSAAAGGAAAAAGGAAEAGAAAGAASGAASAAGAAGAVEGAATSGGSRITSILSRVANSNTGQAAQGAVNKVRNSKFAQHPVTKETFNPGSTGNPRAGLAGSAIRSGANAMGQAAMNFGDEAMRSGNTTDPVGLDQGPFGPARAIYVPPVGIPIQREHAPGGGAAPQGVDLTTIPSGSSTAPTYTPPAVQGANPFESPSSPGANPFAGYNSGPYKPPEAPGVGANPFETRGANPFEVNMGPAGKHTPRR